MFSILKKGRLHNEKVIDTIRFLSRLIDMWVTLMIYELLYIHSSSRIIALMGVAFCMTLNYLIILFPKDLYLKISRKAMIFLFVVGRIIILLALIWKAYYHIDFVIVMLIGLFLSMITALSNGLIILYRQPVSEGEKFYYTGRRIIYLTVPLVVGYISYYWLYNQLSIYYLLYVAFIINVCLLPLIPFIRYNRIVTYDGGELEFTIDGLVMCAIEYLIRVLLVSVVGFEIPIGVSVVLYLLIVVVVIIIAWYKSRFLWTKK